MLIQNRIGPDRAASKRKPSGQTVVEYVLMLAVSITIMATIGTLFRRSLISVWSFYIAKISAACPTCRSNYRIP